MLVTVDNTTLITLTMNRSELKELLDSISSLVMEKVDLNKYKSIFATKDAIVEYEVSNREI